jgi:hypothetical protein
MLSSPGLCTAIVSSMTQGFQYSLLVGLEMALFSLMPLCTPIFTTRGLSIGAVECIERSWHGELPVSPAQHA